ncbi:MAG TPA: hypothetical protein VK427_09380 [Kofleriaceae bacterium]|nr:hypothetical protein [Kofleriaceae bacterium]
MMKLMYLLGGAALAIALGACSKGGGGDFDAFLKLDTEKAAAFNVGGKDCAAKAKSVGEWRAKNTAKYNELRKSLGKQWPDGPPKDIQEKHGETMKANKQAVMGAMLDCSNDPTFSKMMDDTKTE